MPLELKRAKKNALLSPTLNEEQLSELICDGTCTYHEGAVKSKLDRIEVYDGYIIVKGYDGSNTKVCL